MATLFRIAPPNSCPSSTSNVTADLIVGPGPSMDPALTVGTSDEPTMLEWTISALPRNQTSCVVANKLNQQQVGRLSSPKAARPMMHTRDHSSHGSTTR